jgi:hypothetical protein
MTLTATVPRRGAAAAPTRKAAPSRMLTVIEVVPDVVVALSTPNVTERTS